MSFETHKGQFQNYLENEKNRLTNESQQLKSECRDDEYKFLQVELNIVDIFTKMFVISCQKAASAESWQITLRETYLSFFEKIPMAWQENLKKCMEYGLDDEVMIESLKLQRAETIKSMFITMLSESV